MITVNFDSVYRLADGYGTAGENILLALDRHPEVIVHTKKNWDRSTDAKQGLTQRTVELYNKGFNDNADYSIRFSQPDSFSSAPTCRRKKIGWSMWEFTKIPNVWKPALNSVPVRFVSCSHNQRLWKESGANTPTYIVPLGIDQRVFYYRPDGTFHCPETVGRIYKDTSKFTFIISGTLSGRKNPTLVYKVFNELFADNREARLIIKSPVGLPVHCEPTHNVRIINETWWRVRMADLLREADCFVYPTQGEGFGLSPVEAMAVGLPVICTNWSGPADYLDDKYAYKLNYSLGGSTGSHWGDVFSYAIPDRDHLKELMWYVYTHQDEAREKGKLAAQIIASKLTWDHTASIIVRFLKEIG